MNRPKIEQTDEATNRRWAHDAERPATALAWCEVVPEPPDDGEPAQRMWSAPVRLAKERGLPLLADDAALRATARNEGVATFSSLGVLQALVATANGKRVPSKRHTRDLWAFALPTFRYSTGSGRSPPPIAGLQRATRRS